MQVMQSKKTHILGMNFNSIQVCFDKKNNKKTYCLWSAVFAVQIVNAAVCACPATKQISLFSNGAIKL